MVQELYLNDVPGRVHRVVMEEAPKVVSAAEKGSEVEIFGRDGGVWRAEGGLESVSISAKLYVWETADLEGVLGWIRKGTRVRWGRNAFEYHADPGRIEIEVAPWEDFQGEFGWEINVGWTCVGWRYRWPAVQSIIFLGTGSFQLFNPATGYAEPVLSVTGSGSGTIAIGDYQITIAGIPTSGAVISCRDRIAVSGDGHTVLTGALTLRDTDAGRWPRVEPGATQVVVSGGITRLEITPGWRDR